MVQQHGTKWSLIAQELGTGRPPGTVVKAYVKYLQFPANAKDNKRVYDSQPRFVLRELEQQQLLLPGQMESDPANAAADLGVEQALRAAAAAAAAAGNSSDQQGWVAGSFPASGMLDAQQQQQQQRRYTNEESRCVLQLASAGADWQQIGDILGVKPKDVSAWRLNTATTKLSCAELACIGSIGLSYQAYLASLWLDYTLCFHQEATMHPSQCCFDLVLSWESIGHAVMKWNTKPTMHGRTS